MIRHQVAANQGRAVGATIAGKPHPFAKVPIFWSARASFSFSFSFTTVRPKLLIVEGQQLRYCGYGAKHDDVYIKGDPNDMKVLEHPLDLISGHIVIQLNLKVHRVLHQSRQGRSCFKVINNPYDT